MVGIDNKETVFLFTESHIAHESFLEVINNLLTRGTVPALYTDDEKEQIISQVRDKVKEDQINNTKENCWNYFINKCKDNLHIVLCMSPGETLRKRCRDFPGLLCNAAIDWFDKWPPEALSAVANSFLSNELGMIPQNLSKVMFLLLFDFLNP